MELTTADVKLVDPQRKSVILHDGRRLGFVAARRKGLDIEDLLARRPELAGKAS